LRIIKRISLFILSLFFISIVAFVILLNSRSYYAREYTHKTFFLNDNSNIIFLLDTRHTKNIKDYPDSYFRVLIDDKHVGILSINNFVLKDLNNNIIKEEPNLKSFHIELGNIKYIPYTITGELVVKNKEGVIQYIKKFNATLKPKYEPEYIGAWGILMSV